MAKIKLLIVLCILLAVACIVLLVRINKTEKKILMCQYYLDYKAIVSQIFKNYLNREPDEAALEYWEQELKDGKTRQDIINEILETDEYKSKNA